MYGRSSASSASSVSRKPTGSEESCPLLKWKTRLPALSSRRSTKYLPCSVVWSWVSYQQQRSKEVLTEESIRICVGDDFTTNLAELSIQCSEFWEVLALTRRALRESTSICWPSKNRRDS